MFAVNAQWKPQGDKIKTKWAEQVDPKKTLPEYPRPIMERGQWKNLNGLWNYSIQEFGKAHAAGGGQCDGVQPQMGSDWRSAQSDVQAVRSDGHGHPDRVGPLPHRAGAVWQRHHV